MNAFNEEELILLKLYATDNKEATTLALQKVLFEVEHKDEHILDLLLDTLNKLHHLSAEEYKRLFTTSIEPVLNDILA